jgi:RHS repeat-associated protein
MAASPKVKTQSSPGQSAGWGDELLVLGRLSPASPRATLFVMNRGLLHLLLCLLLAFMGTPAWATCRPENRAGGSANFWPNFTSADTANPVAAPAEKPACGCDFASGAHRHGLTLISQQQFDASTIMPSALSYYGYDGHGSVRFLADTNGKISVTYRYDAFASLIASNGTTPNARLCSGHQFDPDLVPYYNRARCLNTDTGRFWAMDSFGGNDEDPLSLHKYLYTQDDPVMGIDPSGHAVYACTRPLNIKGLENMGNGACHVFLAFDTEGLTDIAGWENVVRESWDDTKHPNSYGITYGPGDSDNVTFSFHPKSVLTGDESEQYFGPVLTPSSYIAFEDGIDMRAVNQSGTGYNKWKVASGDAVQLQMYSFAIHSRDRNNNGEPDPGPYEFTVCNCGTWVCHILAEQGLAFPDKTINHGVGIYGSQSSASATGIYVNAAARLARTISSSVMGVIDAMPLDF